MTVSPLTVDPLNASLYTMTITWRPMPSQSGINSVCYTAVSFSQMLKTRLFHPEISSQIVFVNKAMKFALYIMFELIQQIHLMWNILMVNTVYHSINEKEYHLRKYRIGTMNPVGEVHPNQSIWQIQCTHTVVRPSVDAYIRFYSKSTNTQVYTINARTSLNNVI